MDKRHPLSICVIGASGDLARRKIFPALFALYCQKLLPERFQVVGYARSQLSDEAFRTSIMENLTCRYVPGERCQEHMDYFLEHCSYVSGDYDDPEGYQALNEAMHCFGGEIAENRIFYMSIPPFLFLKTAHALHDAQLTRKEEPTAWSRVVIEKPFGSDRASSDELTAGMAEVFTEDQTYRIDHYLGKEVIQNLMVLRFANLIFDPIWNRTHITDVRISWMENLSLEGRAGYFDEYGIIRDVMQNHLLQILALVAMEQPVGLAAEYVRDEKVKALRCVAPVGLDDIVVGQYTAGSIAGHQSDGYLAEADVPSNSRTATYAAAVLHINNRRWHGVPLLVRAGKGLDARSTEIRIRFDSVPGNIFGAAAGHLGPNELVIHIQPDAGISFRIINKVPGLGITLGESELNLQYKSAFRGEIPDAYESLLLDVIQGDKSLFIRSDELQVAWDIFTPVLHELDARNIEPRRYAFGSRGPQAADALAARYNTTW